MTPVTPFIKGGIGVCEIVVSNHGNGSTSGALTVVFTLPKGITCRSLTGSGWTFNATTLTCTYSSKVGAGSSLPLIILIMNVAKDEPNSSTLTATVSGGGAASKMTSTNLTILR